MSKMFIIKKSTSDIQINEMESLDMNKEIAKEKRRKQTQSYNDDKNEKRLNTGTRTAEEQKSSNEYLISQHDLQTIAIPISPYKQQVDDDSDSQSNSTNDFEQELKQKFRKTTWEQKRFELALQNLDNSSVNFSAGLEDEETTTCTKQRACGCGAFSLFGLLLYLFFKYG